MIADTFCLCSQKRPCLLKWSVPRYLRRTWPLAPIRRANMPCLKAASQRAGSRLRHTHTREDEAFYVLEGELTFQVGDQTINAPVGTFVFSPRGIQHSFRVTSETNARRLTLITPAGFEEFFKTPPPSDPTAMRALAERFGLQLPGLPPTP
jgi:hypothetical protein